jgi:response regulator of citrate/malate metabolism
MDDKKFIDNYFAITEHFQEFLISIKKNYQTIDHIIVILSVINHTKKTINRTIQQNSYPANTKEMDQEIAKVLADHPDYGVTYSSISRETNLPRTTVRRICDTFFKKEILKKNSYGLIVMGDRMREQNQTMREEAKKFFYEVAEKFKD